MQDHGRKDVEPMNKFDMMGKDALSKVEEIMNATKLNEFLHRKEEEEKKKTCILWILAIIGVVAAVAAIAYGVYRFFTPDYLEAVSYTHLDVYKRQRLSASAPRASGSARSIPPASGSCAGILSTWDTALILRFMTGMTREP